MLCHPTFGLAKVGSDAKCEALFAEQNVSAVTGVYGNNGVVFWEVADISLLCINVALAVKTAHPVIAVAKSIPYILANTCHDAHV